MTCTLRRVNEADIDRLIADPAEVSALLRGDETQFVISRPKGLLGFLLRLTPISIETATLADPDAPPVLDENELDLDKSWQGLHFLFTGTAWEGDEPASFLLNGGEEIEDDESEINTRLLRPAQVREFAGFLASLSDQETERRYDPMAMTRLEIYPAEIWNRPAPQDESAWDYLKYYLDELKTFVARAAGSGRGLLIYLG